MGQLATVALRPGALVVVDFPGAVVVKRRPAVVLSTAAYHAQRPDVILGLVTGNVAASTADTDHILADWQAAGLRRPSAFRSFLVTVDRRDVIARLGQLSARDWEAVQGAIRVALVVA